MRLALFRPGRAALLGVATAAVAAFPSWGARAAPPREINSQATQMSPRISQCLIRREPAVIDRWLRTLAGSVEEDRLFRSAEPRFPPCFGEPYGLNGSVWLPKYDRTGMRAALVRALLQARRNDLPLAPPSEGGSPWSGLSGSPQTPADGAAIVAADLGACLARKHWGSVLAIVRAVDPEAETSIRWGWREGEAARKREAAAVDSELSKVIPSIPGCVPSGARLRINRLRLRSLLEEAALQMTKQADQAPAGNAPFKPR